MDEKEIDTSHAEKVTRKRGDELSLGTKNGRVTFPSDEESHTAELKVAEDGTVLDPQPSDDPNDPLNWSWGKKHLVLFVISLTALLPDYGSATGAVTLSAQAAQWGTTADEVNHSQAGNVFMLGVGGVFTVLLSTYFGRMPVVFWFLVVSVATAAWCAGATTLPSFMGARILNGFFSTVTQGGGLMFIQDMFFFHEHARKINIWASFFVISPYLGPLLAAFMLSAKPWPTPFWVYTAETAACFVLVVLFLEETYYDRTIAPSDQPPRGTRAERLLGVAQWRSRRLRGTFGQACWRVVRVLFKPTVLLTNFYYMCTFAWVVGVNTTLSLFLEPAYGFGPKQIGFFYFTPIVAVVLGEATGHWLHDLIARQYASRHGGVVEPEARLRAVALALPFMIVGLVLLGQSLGSNWHYMAASVSWGLFVFGIMITTVAVSSYCLDCYPEASGEVSAWLCNSRTVGGFIISYFQVQWAQKQGTKVSFGIQAAVCVAVFALILVMMRWGKRMREWAGPLDMITK